MPNSENQLRVSVQLDQFAIASSDTPELTHSLVHIVKFVASSSSGGADALAQLLMSCYDSFKYPLDITELCRLDDKLYEHAINVIYLRTRENREPHSFFLDGGKLFNQIAADFRIARKSCILSNSADV